MKIIGVIPARYESTRLAGKPLKDICGKTMIQHVYEQACKAKLIERVIVATDDERIVKVVKDFGGEVMMTLKSHQSGSDRVAEIVKKIDCDIVVNIQGDEPLILPEIIDEVVRAAFEDEEIVLATCAHRLTDAKMFDDPNVVKVVTDKYSNALYFSRSVIPYPLNNENQEVFEHIGIYAFKKDFLLKFIDFKDTTLSETESLEQLRVLENGYKIRVVKTQYNYNALSIDTFEDLQKVREIVRMRI